MSEVATTTKTKPTPPAPSTISTRREQTLRSAQVRKFVPSAMQSLGYGEYDRLTVGCSKDWTFADVMNPIAWANVAALVAEDILKTKKTRIGSIIEVHHADFYCELWIKDVQLDPVQKQPNGLILTCLGPAQDKNGKAAPRDLKTGLAWSDPVVEE